MKKILAFAGSNREQSINHKLVTYAAGLINDVEVEVIRLTDFDLPMYSEDTESQHGFTPDLKRLLSLIKTADALLISVNEHNGAVSAFFKNTMDWLSRIEYKFLEAKPVFLMSTSPGKRGALSALEYTEGVLPRFGTSSITTFRLPSFGENFSTETHEIITEEYRLQLTNALNHFLKSN